SLKNLLLSDFTPSLIKKALDNIENFDALRSLLNRALKEEETLPLLSRDGGFIAPHFHGALDELRELKQNNRTYLSELQLKYTALTEVSGLKIGFNNLLGYYIEVPSRSAQALLDKKEVFFHRQTLKSNVRFSTAELAELEEKIKTANEKALAIELSVYEELVQKVMQNAAALQKMAGALSLIDVILGFALVAREKNYTRPLVDSSLTFDIKKGRHLVVEESLKENNASAFVENDCVMDEGNFWLMTGPNMAGKSTFLRQNALIAILAQIGCFVPAEFCHIGVIDKLFSRVGASDDLARGRSTFMVEMIETALILNQAGERSFVILDEIGRGTATFDGLSIAWAAIEYLHEVSRCRTLFATHYHELTDLKENLHRLSLHTMRTKEWQGDVIFLHEVIEGAAEHSYGIHVAKLAGLPKAITKRAEQILTRLESKQVNKDSLLSALPLFSKVLEETKPTPPTLLEQEIRSLDPDTLSPKEALEVLYKLKNLDEKESA
ncbi:MAG: DNA mismatch repair protein MutS, partial [Alphaproteobacteria bacterium]|nr:DNA mismatch repair protein MutS [Alphaproteobacteria bacterium]